MKLIDLLVQHLGSNGGWPEGASICAQDNDGDLFFYSSNLIHRRPGCGHWSILDIDLCKIIQKSAFIARACDRSETTVTHEQYKSALESSNQPEWSGEGLPPIGAKIEVQITINSWAEATVVAITDSWIIAKYQNGCEFAGRYRFLDDNGTWEDRQGIFRPLRTEEKRKRDEATEEIASLIGRGTFCEDAESIYNAIAEGKIPGIRLE